jgi:endonuclease V-like protein UPF0215 family
MLVKKAETIKQASAEAQEALEKLRSDQKTKVCALDSVKSPGALTMHLDWGARKPQAQEKVTRTRIESRVPECPGRTFYSPCPNNSHKDGRA